MLGAMGTVLELYAPFRSDPLVKLVASREKGEKGKKDSRSDARFRKNRLAIANIGV